MVPVFVAVLTSIISGVTKQNGRKFYRNNWAKTQVKFLGGVGKYPLGALICTAVTK
jgi:hypothetical protein